MTKAERKPVCAICEDDVPAEELAAHDGFCASCHDEARADAESLVEWTWPDDDFRHDVEELTRILLTYNHMKVVTAAVQHDMAMSAIVSGATLSGPGPHLHIPS